jgi:uncharacterized protein YyaL (SSP411 family)
MATHHVEILNRRGAPGAICWHDWTAAAFAGARAAGKPVLLFLSATWASGCAVMERRVFPDPAVADHVRTHWIPVRVDSDRRPDIDQRYNLGAWPTTAFLTPGGDILSGGTFFEVDELVDALTRSLASYRMAATGGPAGPPADVIAQPPRESPEAAVDAEAPEWLVEHLLDESDRIHGGFGTGPKGHVVDALWLLLARYGQRGDSAAAEAVTRSLDAICTYLYDREAGGFCRGAERRDWSGVRREKRVADTAALVPLLIEAASVFDRPVYEQRAADAIAWCRSVMADSAQGGFFSSARAAGDERGGQARAGDEVVDRTFFADANAAVAAACLAAGDAWGDTSLVEIALTALERVVLALYRPGAGVSHYEANGVRSAGFLQDHVSVAAALVTAARLTGRVPYVMLAEELMQFSRRTLWDEQSGGFFDRKPPVAEDGDVGLLGERLKPFEVNCQAARTLAALAVLSERADYRDWAARALASQTGVYRSYGVHGAAYALAALDLASPVFHHEPLS